MNKVSKQIAFPPAMSNNKRSMNDNNCFKLRPTSLNYMIE